MFFFSCTTQLNTTYDVWMELPTYLVWCMVIKIFADQLHLTWHGTFSWRIDTCVHHDLQFDSQLHRMDNLPCCAQSWGLSRGRSVLHVAETTVIRRATLVNWHKLYVQCTKHTRYLPRWTVTFHHAATRECSHWIQSCATPWQARSF